MWERLGREAKRLPRLIITLALCQASSKVTQPLISGSSRQQGRTKGPLRPLALP